MPSSRVHEDRRQFGAGHVDAIDRQVGQRGQRLGNRREHVERFARIGVHEFVDVAVLDQQTRAGGVGARRDADDAAAAARRARAPARTPGCPIFRRRRSRTTVCPGARAGATCAGRAGNVEYGERDVVGNVVGQPANRPRFEQDRGPANPHAARSPCRRARPLRCAAASASAKPATRCGRLPRRSIRARRPPDLAHAADEHAAAAGHRIVLLAALGDDRRTCARDRAPASPSQASAIWRTMPSRC